MDVAGKYELLDQIGSGGMATVHRARQRGIAGFDRIVAIKQIHQHLLTEPGFVERFIREARIVSALAHSNIVQIYDFGHSEAGHYIAMEHLEGWPMFKIVHAAASAGLAIPIPVVLSLLYELCDALDHVHTRRRHDGLPLDIVHRDISLGNVFVARSGHLKLIDFGIASAEGLVSDRDGEVAGKPAYMAPETIRGKPIDARVDVYAIGVVAWELLAAARLFSGKDDRATMREVLHATVVPPSRKRADCPPILDSVVLGAMAKDPRKRTATAAILRDQIEVVMRACEVDVRGSTVKRWLKESGLLTMLLGDETSTSESPTTPDRPVRGPTPVAWQAESVPAERPARSISWLRIAAVAAAVAVAPIAVAVRTHSASAPIATIVMTSTHATAHMTVEPIAVALAPPVVPAPIAAPPAPKRHAPRPQPARIAAPPEPERAPAPATAPPPPPPIESTPPPPSPPPPPRIAAPGPVTVPPDRVHLIAGHISRVDRRRLDQEAAVAHRLSAILCIDTRGQVTSAKLLRDLPAWLHDTLVRDLLTFQFSPYQVAGTASAACFVRQLAITTD